MFCVIPNSSFIGIHHHYEYFDGIARKLRVVSDEVLLALFPRANIIKKTNFRKKWVLPAKREESARSPG